jgi:hypothetical protein
MAGDDPTSHQLDGTDDDRPEGAVAPPLAVIEEQAAARLRRPAYTSALGVSDLAACQELGLRPVGLIQGFCAVTRIRWNTRPPGSTAANRTVLADAQAMSYAAQCWGQALDLAYRRMMTEAAAAGAHGVVGVTEVVDELADDDVTQFHVWGTAVVAERWPAPPAPWTTTLAGPRLGKLVEAGFLPVSTIVSRATALLVLTPAKLAEAASYHYWTAASSTLVDGSGQASVISPPMRDPSRSDPAGLLASLHMEVRRRARDQVRAVIGGDHLYDVAMDFDQEELEMHTHLDCILRGNRVRRVGPSPASAGVAAQPVVSLA